MVVVCDVERRQFHANNQITGKESKFCHRILGRRLHQRNIEDKIPSEIHVALWIFNVVLEVSLVMVLGVGTSVVPKWYTRGCQVVSK